MDLKKELKENIGYNKKTGEFWWKIKKKGRRKKIGGLDKRGYKVLYYKGKTMFAHRVARMFVYGKFPDNMIDHINHIKTDNRIENLRDVTNQENCLNRSQHCLSKSGYVGVYYEEKRKRRKAEGSKDGKYVFLGRFDTFKEAVSARKTFLKLKKS